MAIRATTARTAAGVALLITSFALSGAVRPGAATAATVPAPGPLARFAELAAPSVPAGSVDEGDSAPTATASVQVVLQPSDPAGLKALLADLYDPGSSLYHRWLSPAQFDSMFGPSSSTVAETEAWLGQRGLRATRTSTFAITAAASTGSVDRALGTVYHRYRTAAGATGLVAEGAPLVPVDLAGRLAAINGLSTLPAFSPSSRVLASGSSFSKAGTSGGPALRSQALGSAASPAAACSTAAGLAAQYGLVTMNELTTDYGINSLLGAGLTGSGQAVGVYELGAYSPSDVAAYKSCFHLANPVSVTTLADEPPDQTDTGATGEADLDIEQIATQAPGASIISYQAANTNQAAYDLWNQIISADQVKVVSTSWSYCEPDASQAGELSGSLGTLFAEAAADGQTILAASGDSGSEGCAPDYDYGPSNAPQWNAVESTYPASDPNVTAVGGTDYLSAGDEPVWNDCGGASASAAFNCAYSDNFQAAGGGGESKYETRPPWQPDVFDWPAATGALCSPCREVPDLSANAGVAMVIYAGGQWDAGVGTSFAAPLLAGLVADRDQGCATPTGDISPFLYGLAATTAGYAAGFNDVTVGNNDMLADNAGSFPAGAGYDLASGLGSPRASGLACPEVTGVSPQRGVAGQQVTVTGLGLEGATLFFGATPVTPISTTATTAVVDLPPGSGNLTVSASDAYGSGRLTANYGYQGAPPLTPTIVTTPTPTTPTKAACATAGGTTLAGAAGVAAVDINGCDGYFVVDPAGQVAAFGSARTHGDLSGYHLSAPIIAIEATPDGEGYWLLGSDGGVFTFGDARFYGSTGGMRLSAPVVGMAVTPDNKGYWVVARDGGVFTFGDARFYGSTGGIRLSAPVDGIAVAPGGHGYWLVASDGGVFTFTTDGFYGSLGGIKLSRPVVGMSSTPDGRGYTLVAADGGVFSFGDAPFYGSLGSDPPATPVVDLSPAPGNNGYYLVTSGGAVYAFGPGARYFGRV